MQREAHCILKTNKKKTRTFKNHKVNENLKSFINEKRTSQPV
jgi:hypothetical protein